MKRGKGVMASPLEQAYFHPDVPEEYRTARYFSVFNAESSRTHEPLGAYAIPRKLIVDGERSRLRPNGPLIAESAQIGPDVYIDGPVVIEGDAIVGPGAILLGHTVLKRRARVGSEVYLRDTGLGYAAQVEDAALMVNSSVEDGSTVPKEEVITDNIKRN